MTKIRICLIDDHLAVRQAVAVMLEAAGQGFEVVGQSDDAETGIAELLRLKPDVAIIDLKMPGMSGLSAIAKISSVVPATRSIVFTMYDNPAYVWETINAGASGYLLKSASKDELVRAVRAVFAGSGYLQAEVTMPLLKRFAHDARTTEARKLLTLREMQILECLAEGESNKGIGRRFCLGEETVKTHLRNLYEKLGASDRAHAVAIALRQRLIE
jgi:DNA-binding NarL/FixJ family response regulator